MTDVGPDVRLVAIDEDVLRELVAVAVADAAPDEVTPPLTDGPAWTPERVAWLRDYHRARRGGLAGPCGEVTRAVMAGGRAVGVVRLKSAGDPGGLETGIWLARGTRGQGCARAAMTLIVAEAARLGASVLRADTTAGNAAALAVLRHLGFVLSPDPDGVGVIARLRIGDRPD